MKKITSVLAVFLCLAMLFSGFAGCKSKKTTTGNGSVTEEIIYEDETDSAAAQGGSTASGASIGSAKSGTTISGSVASKEGAIVADPSATKLKESIADLKGATITLSTYWEALLIGTQDGKPVSNGTDGVQGVDSNAVKNFKAAIAAIEKDYNCKIQFIYQKGDFLTQVTNAVSSGKAYADIMQIVPSDFFSLAPAGILTDITNSNITPKDPLWCSANTKYATLGGKVYGVEHIMANFEAPLRKCMFFNKTLLNTYAKGTNLYDMVKNGTWTWDEFTKLCSKVKTASGNKVGGVIAYNPQSLALGLISSNGSYMAAPSGKGYAFAGTDAATLDALTFSKKIKDDGNWVAPDETQKDNNRIVIPFENEKSLFLVHNYYLASINFAKDMKDDYGVIPIPKGPNAKGYNGSFDESHFFTLNTYSSNVKNGNAQRILLAIALRTYLKDWKSFTLKNSLRDTESLEMIELMLNNPMIDITFRANNFAGIVMPQMENIFNGSITPKASMQSVAGMAQAELKKMFG